MDNKTIEICVRAVVQDKGRVLVCRNKEQGYYFFPGGHLEFGERVEDALAREIKEEIGAEVRELSFIGAVNNIFEQDGEKHHEINFVFDVKLHEVSTKSKEDHLDFFLLSKEEFDKALVYPLTLKHALMKWFEDGEMFWAGGE